MVSTVFVDASASYPGTPLVASWFNDVNNFVYSGVVPPSFLVSVGNGGTGLASVTAYAPLVGGTTTAGPLQVASTGQSNSGYVLTSTGASSLPTWQAAAGGGTPGGSDTQLQYNNAGAFGGISGATTDGTKLKVTRGNLSLTGTSTGVTLLNSGLSSTLSNSLTLPITSADTLAGLSTVQTWLAAQTLSNGGLSLLGTSTGKTTLNSGLGAGSNNTLTLPITASDTLAALGTVQSWTAVQTYNNSTIKLLGSSSGATTFTSANAGASNFTVTVPAVTGTLYISGQGASAAVAVTDGGTGLGTLTTAYAPVCAGTTATGNLQVASTGLSTSGWVLTSTGSSSLPTFQAPTGGAQLNVANTWVAAQTFTNSDLKLLGSSSGATTFTSANAGASNFTLTIPALTGTMYVSGQGAGAAVAVTDGGTGVGTMTTAYAPVCAGTTATGNLQVASTGIGTSGFVLTSNGASALPSFKAAASSVNPGTVYMIANNFLF